MEIDAKKIPQTVKHAMSIISNEGFTVRIVGGAVRDLIRNNPVNDWDLATDAEPQDVIAIFNQHNIEVAEVGIQHGTVMALMPRCQIEITTLRIDKKTNGRHAVVEFTKSWRVDAKRRDFTINAMSMDASGKITDYFGGIEDLKANKVVFVGDPDKRIKEDYIRLLRFFRFRHLLNDFSDYEDIENSIIDNRHGLDDISGERIWSEMKKMFSVLTQLKLL
jgi:tRNA nucleotidyltransferase/poly(A) polymerase